MTACHQQDVCHNFRPFRVPSLRARKMVWNLVMSSEDDVSNMEDEMEEEEVENSDRAERK